MNIVKYILLTLFVPMYAYCLRLFKTIRLESRPVRHTVRNIKEETLFTYTHEIMKAINKHVVHINALSCSDVVLIRNVEKKPFTYKYAPYGLFGININLNLRGGEFYSSVDWNCVKIDNVRINSISPYIHKKKRIFTCFNSNYYSHGHIAPVFFPFKSQKTVDKAIFFDCNYSISDNYFHFIIDALPSLLMSMISLKRFRDDWSDFKVLCPTSVHPNIRAIVQRVCNHADFQIIDLIGNTSVKVQELVVTNYPSSIGHEFPQNENYSVSPLAIRFTRRFMRAAYKDIVAKAAQDLYITRGKPKNSLIRHLVNHKDISESLGNKGIKTLNFNELSLEEQISCIKGAEKIVFDGGAVLASLIYAQNTKKVIILAMNSGTDASLFVSFCQTLGINVSYACGPIVLKDPSIPLYQCSYNVPLKYILKALRS